MGSTANINNQRFIATASYISVTRSGVLTVLFANNVGSQATNTSISCTMQAMNTIVHLLPDKCTDNIQPVNTGFGRNMRDKIGEAMQIWLGKKGMTKFQLKTYEDPDDTVDRACID